MSMDTNTFILTLLGLKGWGPNKIYNYIFKHSFVYEECVNDLVNTLDETEKADFKQILVKSKNILKKNYELGVRAINIFDKLFPRKLYEKTDKCIFLYYKGDISLLSKRSIAIIGTRKPTPDFIEKGVIATRYFTKKGCVIVSGLAIGCDTIAHKICIENGGKTIAVLPSSCDNIYPAINKSLGELIVKNGGLLISEYSTGSLISKYNYVQRDRIQSLLCSVILIIQASNESGTMNATKKNIKDGKPVYAISGNNLNIIKKYLDVNFQKELEEVSNHIL